MRNGTLWVSEESSFVVLRALAMLGGMVAILLVPHPPEHQPYLGTLAWSFVAYKVALFLAIRMWAPRLRAILLASVGADLIFVSLFVWFGGGMASHFYLLFYLLVALVAVQFEPRIGVATAGTAGGLYAVATMGHGAEGDWHHLVARVATFFLLAGSLGYLSQRERLARSRAEALNRDLQKNQQRLEQAYQDLQAAQSRLLQSERLATIGKMSAKVAHEVRNPLSSVSLNTELLEDEISLLPDGRRAEAGKLLRAIRSQIDVLSAVTEGYLRFARPPKPKLELASLGPVIVDLADFVREELRARKVQLIVDVERALPTLRMDAGQIRQALLNLIRNGAEAMPDGGTITLAARLPAANGRGAEAQRRGGVEERKSAGTGVVSPRRPSAPAPPRLVELTVTDTGAGIPPEDLGQIFEPFFTRKEGGTGLGLAISREIALGHGGTLTCESVPGQGTTFCLTLPVPEPEGGR
jgi:signal transduction histidine kinase